MPTAKCNNCQNLVHWRHKGGGSFNAQKCQCGSKDLTAVSGHLEGNEWVYRDRKGNVVKIVPRDAKTVPYGPTHQR